MARFSDLPNEVIDNIISYFYGETVILPKSSQNIRPNLRRSTLHDRHERTTNVLFVASLALLSRRTYGIAQTRLLQHSLFSMPPQITKFLKMLKAGRKRKSASPMVVMRTFRVEPKGHDWADDSVDYTSLRTFVEKITYLDIICTRSSSKWSASGARRYLRLAGTFNPTHLRIATEYEPGHTGSLGIVEFSIFRTEAGKLVKDVLQRYDRLEKLEISYLTFDERQDVLFPEPGPHFRPFVEAIRRLPLRALCMSWPTGLSPSMVVDILSEMATREPCTGLRVPPLLPMSSTIAPQVQDIFLEENENVTFASIERLLLKQGRSDLLRLLTWEIRE